MQKMLPQNKIQVLRLLVKNVFLCLPLNHVNKILPLMMLEPIPHSPLYILGLLNFAGNSIPVIDLAVRLGYVRDQPYSLDIPIMLCTQDSRELAFVVDKVLGIADLAADSLQMQAQFDKAHSLFLGSVAIDNQLTFLLNVENLFDVNLMTAEVAHEFK